MSIAENPLLNPTLNIHPMIIEYLNHPVDYSSIRDIETPPLSLESQDFVHKVFMKVVREPNKPISFSNFKEASSIFKSAIEISAKKHH